MTEKIYKTRIIKDSDIMGGRPVIAGTRITVESILRYLGEGITEEELLDEFPQLTHEDIRAAQAYAADMMADEEIIIL